MDSSGRFSVSDGTARFRGQFPFLISAGLLTRASSVRALLLRPMVQWLTFVLRPASALTVAVPFRICTGFSILRPSLPGLGRH